MMCEHNLDTKKYEGHTSAQEWVDNVLEADGILDNPFIKDSDANLIINAPLILEALITAEARIKELEEALESVEHQVHCHRIWRGQYYEQNAIVPPFATKIAETARAALKGKE